MRNLRRGWALALTAVLLLSPLTAPCEQALEEYTPGRLRAAFESIEENIRQSPFEIPIHLEFEADSGLSRGDVNGIFDFDLPSIADALGSAEAWCGILPLHFNVKACTWRKDGGKTRLSIYMGRKFYETPAQAHRLDYELQIRCNPTVYCLIRLTASKGPFGTHDHKFELQAIPLEGARTFVRFSYVMNYGLTALAAIKTYFATLGRDKVGFSIAGMDNDGNPIYVQGLQGLVERNAVRYYLATQAYMETRKTTGYSGYETRLNRWFDLSEPYHEQLFEMPREDYLRDKKREWAQQRRLQSSIDRTD